MLRLGIEIQSNRSINLLTQTQVENFQRMRELPYLTLDTKKKAPAEHEHT